MMDVPISYDQLLDQRKFLTMRLTYLNDEINSKIMKEKPSLIDNLIKESLELQDELNEILYKIYYVSIADIEENHAMNPDKLNSQVVMDEQENKRDQIMFSEREVVYY